MNRVFAPEAPIDLEPLPAETDSPRPALSHRPQPPVAPPPPRAARGSGGTPAVASAPPQRRLSDLTVLLAAMVGGVGMVGALGAVLLVQQWTGLQRNLSQERNLLLVERLRSLGPATAPTPAPPVLPTPSAPALDPRAADAPAAGAETREVASFDGLPPPPPEEPWMAQLATLPPSGGRPPLRVPLSPRLTATAPAALPSPVAPPRTVPPGSPRPRFSGPLPQLVGLVGAPGRAGSAIFQVGGSAMTVTVGERIGGSGWLLRAADTESAVIERGTEVRRVTIASGG
jgi:hypothetical protein